MPDDITNNAQPTGVSTPPNNGDVNEAQESVSGTPAAEVQTNPNPSVATQSTNNTATTSNPMAQPPAQGLQPSQPNQPMIPAKQPEPAPASIENDPNANHPSVKKAGVIHSVAQALAGGPRFTYTVDENGNMQRKERQLTTRQILAGLAVEALQGAAAGASAKPGPNYMGRAAGAGFQAGEATQQNVDQQQKEMATADYNRRMQVTETNMRMYSMAKNLGKQDLETNQSYIKGWEPTLDFYTKNHPDMVEGAGVRYQDFGKYNATMHNAIPDGIIARPGNGPNGQAVDDKGVPLWDLTYTIIDPNKVKAAGLLSPDMLEWGKKYGFTGFNNPHLGDSPMSGVMAMNLGTQVMQTHLQDEASDKFFSALNNNNYQMTGLTGPDISNFTPEIENAAMKAAQTYNVPLDIVNAMIKQESGGGPNAAFKVSKAGAQGVMQLMPKTAAGLNVKNVNDVDENVDAGTRYFASLLYGPAKGDITRALQMYNVGPSGNPNNSETEGYVKDIGAMLNLKNVKVTQAPTITGKNFAEEVSKSPALRTAMAKFNSYIGAAGDGPNQWGRALSEMEKTDPSSAALVKDFYGGNDQIDKYDLEHTLAVTQSKLNQTLNSKIAQQEATHQEQIKFADEQFGIHDAQGNVLDPNDVVKALPQDFDKMSESNMEDYFKSKGMKMPPMFTAAYDVANYKAGLKDMFPQRVWAGSIGEADTQRAASLIKLINPNWSQIDYDNKHKFALELSDTRNKTAGGLIQSASVAAAHINQLQQLAYALDQANNHNNIQPLNKIANQFHVAIGQTPANSYQAVATAVGQEVAKAVAGDKPAEDVVDAYIKSLNNKNALQQTTDVAKNYSELMYKRIYELNEQSQSILGKDLSGFGVGQEASKQWQSFGWNTPWATGGPTGSNNSQTANQPQVQQYQKPDKSFVSLTPPQNGAIPGFDKTTGQLTKWRLPNGQVVSAQSGQ